MLIIVGCSDEKKLQKFKKELEAGNHEVLAVSSKESWQNLIRDESYLRAEAVISEHWLNGFYGHDMVAKIGHHTPALIWNVKKNWFNVLTNKVLQLVSFPNTVFTCERVEVAEINKRADALKVHEMVS
ncbi:MAG: hypothetical protein V4606_01890 [Patescibacteria group bacterium]